MKRLVAHRAAAVGMIVVFIVASLGLSAPFLAENVLHLSPEEQHTSLRFAGPGVRDAGRDFPRYDGDAGAFSWLDTDRDGRLACTLKPAAAVTDAIANRAVSAAAANADIDPLPTTHNVPVRDVVAAFAGRYDCPEIDRWRGIGRVYDLLIELHDVDHDSELTPREWPAAAALDKRLGRASLAAAAAHTGFGSKEFARIDRDGNGRITRDELLDGARITRIAPRHLLAHHDDDGDLAISAAEFPGLPAFSTFLLGTDGKGRDLLVRLLFGARVSLLVGLLATAVALFIGVTWGAIAGYVGGRVDGVMMRIVDALYGLPFMFIVILLLVVAGRSTVNLFIALGAVSWLSMARIVRGQVLSIREREYVVAARALGATPGRILLRHVLPATVGPVVVYGTLLVPAVILEEALLSFLGLGVQPPDASWGTLIAEGAGLMAGQPWLIVFPAAMLATTLLSLNFVGDGLRDAMDPKG